MGNAEPLAPGRYFLQKQRPPARPGRAETSLSQFEGHRVGSPAHLAYLQTVSPASPHTHTPALPPTTYLFPGFSHGKPGWLLSPMACRGHAAVQQMVGPLQDRRKGHRLPLPPTPHHDFHLDASCMAGIAWQAVPWHFLWTDCVPGHNFNSCSIIPIA